MRQRIRHQPTGIVLDLSEPDLGHQDGMDILLRHYRQSENSALRFTKASPAFVCLKHEDGTNPGLFVKKSNKGTWFAVHYVGSGCTLYRLPSPMSDEHKRQAEYWARAAEAAGYRTETEWRLNTGTRPDVLIRGPVMTGVEVQRSYIRRSTAVARTRKAERAGVKDVWFTDNGTVSLPGYQATTGMSAGAHAGAGCSPRRLELAQRYPTGVASVMGSRGRDGENVVISAANCFRVLSAPSTDSWTLADKQTHNLPVGVTPIQARIKARYGVGKGSRSLLEAPGRACMRIRTDH